jgi:hypothetical protein
MLQWDKSIQVGDFVISNYHKNSIIYKVSKIERRFLVKSDLKCEVYKNSSIGDEYSPIVTIIPVIDTSFDACFSKKKLTARKAFLDCTWLNKMSSIDFNNYLQYLSDLFMNI